MNASGFEDDLSEMIGHTFAANPQLIDHRRQYPWWTGSLGNPFAGIWFVAERLSLFRLNEVADKHGSDISSEMQWAISRGDMLFREALVSAGFKSGGLLSAGGWNCYITNLVKDCGSEGLLGVGATEPIDLIQRAMIWSDVLRWELEKSRPRMVVLMSKKLTRTFFEVLEASGMKPPVTLTVESYAYVAFKPKGKLGPMDPNRVEDYIQSFRDIRKHFDSGPS